MPDIDNSKPLTRNWMREYSPPEGYYDEYLDAEGKPRPHWARISDAFGRIDKDSWKRRKRQLDRLIQDNGITYNVYGENKAHLHPWSMDLLPHVLGPEEVAKIESALSQRATLLNIVLGDVYGRQTMLQSSRMPPFLIYSNPNFLRPCHGLLSPRSKHIHLYAADISRAPDGNWWVLGDRVEAASGLGYALENRMLSSRIFPKIMWEARTRSLQPFINAFTQHIESLAPQNSNSPNIALLTAGPNNETYFEQSFLARNLGYTLAEGADLTVRNNRLYMKTIGGVQQVDVLLRRIDSSWTDPLELRNESLIGIPGLVNAVRQGNVSIANALGSGFVETSAMLAFLPWFCRNYLGENLEMPSVATWWCGQESERKYVLDNLDNLAIKPTFWGPGAASYFGPSLSSKQKEELVAKIHRYPESFCGQEIVSNGTIPVDIDGALQPRHFQLRVFLAPTENGWKMMPGGLLRYAQEENDVVVSMQQGGATKDTWALRSKSDKSERSYGSNHDRVVVERRHYNDLPSRTADNLFWLGRYVERAEGLTRVLRSLCSMMVDEADRETHQAALPFLRQILPPGSDTKAFVDPKTASPNLEKVEKAISFALFEEKNLESLVSNFASIDRAANKAKERLSNETWFRLTELKELAQASVDNMPTVFDDETLYLLDKTLETLASFSGNLAENTTRSQGWRFLEIGRRLERALSISFLLSAAYKSTGPNDETLVAKLLEWGDSSITYRRRYLNNMLDTNLLEVLCFDTSNPRSLAFQIEQLRHLLEKLPHTVNSKRHPIDQAALRLYSRIGLSSPEQLMSRGLNAGGSLPLLSFLEQTNDDLLILAQRLEQSYFAHTQVAQQQKSYMNLA
ncbi:circularly permuted type 2 ATP-grasp protein [Pelagicoccus sp. SDUM812003]|uniref:circularly permuted type 2 ATP-grasp protein n=1 Tax=Pelagicoccus sp. SDUM812003 TaxID=3041267 RepID=UPI00280D37EF|nr:circularly permuted type 2 ATP-grasp protein [Pelagicoccus sp. SDUM812003]MDQ8204754.1 circularly permuted type 2 ATP-grasp protein [Pelagicoccus sp. SDUM812003]